MSSSRFGRIRPAVLSCLALLLALSARGNFAPVCPNFDTAGSPVAVGNHPSVIALGDFNGDGKLDFVVANTEANLEGSDSVSVLLGDGAGGFSEASGSPVDVGDWPIAIAVGDFDRDGNLDLAVANESDDNVSILLGDGTGGFSEATGSPVGVGSYPVSVAVGDFDRDGKLDLLVGNYYDSNVNVLVGDGAGGFSAASPVSLGAGHSSLSVVAGDFDSDGKLDFAASDYGSGVRIFLGDGAGGFSEALGSPVSVGANPDFLATADLDGDGKLDLVVANYWANSLSILLGDGSGSFTQASGSPIGVGAGPNRVAIGDLDGDGKLDLAVANYDGWSLSILLGNGAGGFGVASISPVEFFYYDFATAIGDFNGDGKPDLAVSLWGNNKVAILLNTCDAITCTGADFAQPAGSPVDVGTRPYSVAVGDFNGDGKLDFAVADGSDGKVSIRLGDGAGGFSAAPDVVVGPSFNPASVVVGDFNRDGKPDLATANEFDGSVSILLGDGLGGFTVSGSPIGVGDFPLSVAAGDFNRDGKLDLAAANINSNNVSILLGDGLGGFTAAPDSPFDVGLNPYSVAVGDFDRDGNLDLAVANYGGNNVSVLLGDGLGGFTEASGSPFGAGANPNSVAVGDFNRDGNLDLAVANYIGDNLSILLGNGAGGFAATSPVATWVHPTSVAVGDFDRDGKLDLAVANAGNYNVSIFAGNGDATFSGPASFDTGAIPNWVAVGDFNGDAKPDLAVANLSSDNVSVLLNACVGGPCASTTTAVTNASTPSGVAVNLTATVTSSSTVNAGSVTFKVNDVSVGTASVVSGTATLLVADQTLGLTGVYPNLSPGDYTILADYGGTGAFCASTNTGTLTVVSCASTTTAVTNASTPSGAAVNLTATVTASSTVTSGTVTFYVDSVSVGTALVVNGTATLLVADQTLGSTGVYPNLSPGDYTIEADYSGNESFCTSGNTGTLTVSEAVVTCPKTTQYWRDGSGEWPVSTLTLGSQSYTKAQLIRILKKRSSKDASLVLSDELIAAKLNVALGVEEPAAIATAISAADALLLLNPHGPVKPESTLGVSMSVQATTLASYNNGSLTSGCTP